MLKGTRDDIRSLRRSRVVPGVNTLTVGATACSCGRNDRPPGGHLGLLSHATRDFFLEPVLDSVADVPALHPDLISECAGGRRRSRDGRSETQ
jgi:hypothetical protein